MIGRVIRAGAKLLATEACKSAATAAGTEIGQAIGKRIGASIYVTPSPKETDVPSSK